MTWRREIILVPGYTPALAMVHQRIWQMEVDGAPATIQALMDATGRSYANVAKNVQVLRELGAIENTATRPAAYRCAVDPSTWTATRRAYRRADGQNIRPARASILPHSKPISLEGHQDAIERLDEQEIQIQALIERVEALEAGRGAA